MLVGLFLFWQCFQVYDVLKHNVQRNRSFGAMFWLDVGLVLVAAYGVFVSIDWLVGWLESRRGGFFRADNLGWLTGWLMVLPNALLALWWGWKRRADVVFASQVGDGHICIPLGLGLYALFRPLPVTEFAERGLWLLLGTAGAHILFLLSLGGLPRWAGGVLVAAYGWFLWTGLG
jgi:cation:H+ antiporter